MFADFKLIVETAVSVFKSLAGQKKREWAQLGKLFDKIADALDSMAGKYESHVIPRTEFVTIQIYADELQSCWKNMPLSGRGEETQKWIRLLDEMITTADGTDAAYFGFRAVPGPFYSRKEGLVERGADDDAPVPEVAEIRDAAAAFRAAAIVLEVRGA